MAHVSEYKKKLVKEFVNLIKQYPIVGAVNMQGLPAPQLQKMRALLRDTVVLKMAKRRLINIALEEAKADIKGIEKLEEHLEGMPALLFTKENPFKLYKKLQKNKSSAPAKGGQTAPKDIEVKAGPTSFMPGPIIGELGSVGIKCSVEGGKIAIKEDSVVVKKGEEITPKVAEILTRLGVEPMEVGLDLVATYEDGTVFTKDVLEIDETAFINKIHNAARWALNLSIESAYPTKDNIELLVTKAFTNSKGLALEQNIMADAVAEELLTKAERQMINLKNTANIDVTTKPKEESKIEEVKEKVEKEKKEEKPAEEVKEPEQKQEDNPKPEETKTEQKETPTEQAKEETKQEQAEKNKEIETEETKQKPEGVEPKKEEDIIAEAEKASEEDEKVQAAKENIEEDKKEIKEQMEEDIKEAQNPEKKEELEESKEVIEKEIEKDSAKIKKEEKEAQNIPTTDELVEQTKDFNKKDKEKVPTASDLLKEKKEVKEKPEPEKVPSAHELLAKKKKHEQKSNLEK